MSRFIVGARVRLTTNGATGTVVERGPFCDPAYTAVEFDDEQHQTFPPIWNVRTDRLEIIGDDE